MTITAAGIAVVVLGFLLFRGETGRIGMLMIAITCTALGIAADLRDMLVNVAGSLTSLVNSIGGGL